MCSLFNVSYTSTKQLKNKRNPTFKYKNKPRQKKSNTPFHCAPNGPQCLAAFGPHLAGLSPPLPLLFLAPCPPKHSSIFPMKGEVLRFPAHSLSGQRTLRPQSGVSPAQPCSWDQLQNSCLTTGNTQPSQGSQGQCGRGGFKAHPSRPLPKATSSGKPSLILGTASDCSLLSTPGPPPNSPNDGPLTPRAPYTMGGQRGSVASLGHGQSQKHEHLA